MLGLWGLPCFTHAEWIPKCTKLCMNAMRKLQCVEVTVLQEFAQWTVDDVQVAGLLWAAQTRFDIRHHTPLASLEAWGFPSSIFQPFCFLKRLESHDFTSCCHHMPLENIAQPCGSHMIIMITHICHSQLNLVKLISSLAAVPFQVLHGCANGSNIFRLAAGRLAVADT